MEEEEGQQPVVHLRHTRDYRAVAAAVEQLRRQRRRALHDIARLALLRERALAAPVPFVLRLKRAATPHERATRVVAVEKEEDKDSEGSRPKRLRDDTDGEGAEEDDHDDEEGEEDEAEVGELPQRQKVVRLPRINLRSYAHAPRPRRASLPKAAAMGGRRVVGAREPPARGEAIQPEHQRTSPDRSTLAGEGDEVLAGGVCTLPARSPLASTDSSLLGQPQPSCSSLTPGGAMRGLKEEPCYDASDEWQAGSHATIKQESIKEEMQNGDAPVIVIEPKPGDVIRGRVWDEDKPSSFNKLWGPEEQRRLEQLLIEIPEEEVAAHRWAKIARALGNRTPRQVASRVQKYFIKLARAGLPVPGKPPNLEERATEGCYYTPPPVQMPDEDDSEMEDTPARRNASQQPLYDDEDYRTYRSLASNYLDPAFMPS